MLQRNVDVLIASARNAIGRIHHDEQGQGMTEYVIILVAIAVVCIMIAVSFGGKIKGLFETANTEIDDVDSGVGS